ncbi:hypothetical protein MB46_02945 [Arthrobacter alpinus]|uniref:FHA domain-containing protein n=1 Tax=Arthrobacter alpinus TaxID=656366 RepID=UPI0005C95D1D|nr:FHA domain-containing protein [Arthrobacter alpinus]ALV44630.1 hypothetical protein MB46_02945 [Arthrobacter alpinus]
MVSTTYNTGSWLGIVRSGSLIVLEGQTNPAIVAELWDFLGQEPTIHGVLNEVTEKFGTGLTGMPHFAIVVQSDRLHAILRGNITLVARTADGIETVSGRDVTTWSERSLPLADSIELTLDESIPVEDTLTLPLGEGVVRLQSVVVLADGATVSATVPVATALPEVQPYDAGPLAPVPAETVPAETDPVEVDAVEAEPAETEAADVHDGDVDPVEDGQADSDPEYDEETLASFAKAAEAADAEWNAQLAPLDEPGALEHFIGSAAGVDFAGADEDIEPDDLSRTIIPEPAEESDGAEDSEPSAETGLESEPDSDLEAEESAEPVDPEASDQEPETSEAQPPAAAEAVDDGFTINYDYLFGATTMAQSVEAAAVRLDEDGQPIAQEAAEPSVPPMPTLPPVAGTSVDVPAEAFAADNGENVVPVEAPVPATWPEGILIDSVPWRQSSDEAVAPSTSEASAPVPSAPAQAYDPDHDGHTVMRGDVISDLNQEPDVAQLESRPPTGPVVLARMCPNGHANPPSRSQCSECGSTINSEPREVGRPRLGTMHISTGEVVELDHSLIIGRQPSVSRVMGGAMPRLVQVKSENGDISRSHVEIRLDGWEVLLVDLKATNGTVLVREGQAPRRLSQGEEAILLNGDIAELGDGISLLFDGLL